MTERPLTVAQLADRWDFSEDFVMHLINDGALKAFSVSPQGSRQQRCLRISQQAIDDFANHEHDQEDELVIFQLGTVYIADSGEFTKIGFTTRKVEWRLAGLQTSSPMKVSLWATIPGSLGMEAGLHEHFEHLRHRGEWFALDVAARQWLRQFVFGNGGKLVD